MSAYILQVTKNDIQKEFISPSATYFSERYLSGADNWTRVKDKTTFGESLVKSLTPIISTDCQKSILDIGCGTLWLSRLVMSKFPAVSIHGIDFAFDAIVRKYPDLLPELSNAGITHENADWLSFKSLDQYDFIFDFGLFHHLVSKDWPRYVAQFDEYLLPGGHLFIRSFHPTDNHWSKAETGGHLRKGYYCHYHTLTSLGAAFRSILSEGYEIELCRHSDHVEGLYHFQKVS